MLNNWSVMGRLGADPEMRTTAAGKQVCSWRMAVNRIGKDKEPLWVKVSVWDRQADAAAKYLTKGSQVVVTGEVDLDLWTDKSGQTRATVCVPYARSWDFAGPRPGESGGSPSTGRAGGAPMHPSASAAGQSAARGDGPMFDDGDVPF